MDRHGDATTATQQRNVSEQEYIRFALIHRTAQDATHGQPARQYNNGNRHPSRSEDITTASSTGTHPTQKDIELGSVSRPDSTATTAHEGDAQRHSSHNSNEEDREADNDHLNKEKDPYLVDWSDLPRGSDPLEWSDTKKWLILGFYCLVEILASALSSVYSSGIMQIEMQFGITEQVALLGQSLFVVGLAIAPLVLAPLSEYYGRNPVYAVSIFVTAIFQIPAAYQTNIQTLLIARFIAGCAASVPLTNTGGTVADMFERDYAGRAVALFAFAGAAGPSFGPAMAGYIAFRPGWRWIFWVQLIIFGVLFLIQIAFLPETKRNILLKRRAKALRKEKKDDRYRTEDEEKQRASGESSNAAKAVVKLVGAGASLLATEPIVLSLALYNGYLYGLVYIFFESYPLVFEMNHGWNVGQTGLAFLGIVLGALIALFCHAITERRYRRKVRTQKHGAQPEDRLEGALIGSVAVPVGLFWFAWTLKSQINPLSPVFAGVPFGFGVYWVYYGVVNYVTDGYGESAASALAAVSFVRSSIGAGLTHVAPPTYQNLGYTWATAMLGFIAIPMIAIPWLLYIYGPKLRQKSRHAPNPPEDLTSWPDS